MVCFWNLITAMCIPIYTKCRTCKYSFFISPTRAKCRHFVLFDNPYILKDDNKEYIENELFLDVEIARLDESLCGRNASYYKRRIS